MTAHDLIAQTRAPRGCAVRVCRPPGRDRPPADEQLRITRKPRVPPKPVARASAGRRRPSRQFARNLATTVARDPRLSPSATRLAVLLVAVCGKANHVDATRGYFASRLGVSERTVARLLAMLRVNGYVSTVRTVGERNETTGLRIRLLDALLPYWDAEREQGVTKSWRPYKKLKDEKRI